MNTIVKTDPYTKGEKFEVYDAEGEYITTFKTFVAAKEFIIKVQKASDKLKATTVWRLVS